MKIFLQKIVFATFSIFLLTGATLLAQVPGITSFTPVSGAVGASVTITGVNFNVTPASNIVYFGATKATVTAATATSLTVTVPAGATFKPLTVLNTANGLIGSSLRPFATTYTGMVSSGSLESPVSLNGSTNYPREVAIADFDGDGKADVATIGQNGLLSIFRNVAASGSLTITSFSNKVDFTTGSGPFGLAVGDLDGDGKQDIVVANASGNSISVFRNTAVSGAITTASFAAKVDFSAVSSPNSLALADLDADGKLEIAVTNNGSNSVSVFKNATTVGSITAASFATRQDFVVGSSPNGVVLGDVDGDGKADMAVANYSSNTMSVLRNLSVSGTISFNGKVDFATGSNPYGITMGDLDGDGKLDLSVSNYNSYTVSIYRNTAASGLIAAASLASRVDYSVPAYPTGITLGDLNGDGKQEILVSAYGNSYPVTALRNAATSGSITGTSFSAINYNYGYFGYGLAVGDLDGDGKADVVNTSEGTGSTIQVYRNNPAPIFSSFSPTTGAAGTTVTISGRNFTGATAVRFNAVNATSFSVVNDNQITAVAPTGVTSGLLTVTTAIGTGTSITFYYAAPTITSFTPVTGGSGASVTITGTNLLGTTSVQFGTGGSSAPTGTPTNTSVVVKVPGNANTGTLRLTTPYGTVASTASFTPTVLVSSFSPTTGTAGTTFYIYGSGFTGATAVRINSVAVSSFIVQSDNQIYVVIHNGVTTGPVSVVSPTGTGTSVNNFYAAPSITSFTPTAAATGATVTLTGLNFTDASTIRFNGVDVAPTAVTATSITVAVPAGAISGPLTVFTPYGSSASSAQFTAVPIVNSFNTYSGPVGTQITISGNNFTNVSAVKFNGVSAGLFTVNSSTQISATVPSSVTEGAVSVTNTAGTGTGPVFSPTPTITGISPVSGPIGTTVTITGFNFTGATTVRFFNNVNATPISVSATTITVAVPSGAYGSSTLRVSTPSGSGTSSMNFTVTDVPYISNFNPTSGSIGSNITINGSGFIGTTIVRINGVSASSFTVNSESQITAVVPNAATSGPLSVTTSQGTATTSNFFIVNLSSSITGFAPLFAAPGETVTISGLNLGGASAIKFGGVSGTVTNSTATTVTAIVPSGALSGIVQITTPLGTCSSLTNFLISPRLTGYYNPNYNCYNISSRFSITAGQQIRIQGQNLDNTTAIQINGIATSGFSILNSSELETTVPSGVGSGSVVAVTTSAGNASFGIPVISTISPASGNFGALVSISGNNLGNVSSVSIGGSNASFSIISQSQINIVVPVNCQSGNIQCSYSFPSTYCAPFNSYSYTAAGSSSSPFIVLRAPEVSSFTPTAGGAGTVVTITGNHFLGATAVRFNNVAATSFTVVDNNTIQATAPAGVTSGVISVVHPGGTTNSTQIFNLMAAPTITATGLSVLIGPVGTQVTITGTNFLAPSSQTSVSFAGINCPFSIISATQILAVVPPGGFTSSITVKTPGGSAVSTQQFTPTGVTTVRVDSVTAVPNLQVVVPVRVRGFANLIGLQFNVPTPSGLTYVGVEQLNATLALTTANFSNVNGVQFTWSQASNTATNLSDNTVLFAIRYSVPINTLSGTKFNLVVPIGGFPLPLEATKSDFAIQTSTAINGFVRVAPATISGTIKTGNGTGVPRAILVMKTSNTKIPKADTTASDGSFSYDSLAVGANYSMQADKNTDPFPTNGVTVSDVALIQRHILAASLLGNAYKVIAADVDNSKSVTVADVAFIRDLILQTRSTFPLGKLWKMVKASQTFTDQNLPWPLDTAFTYTGLPTATTTQNFIGCKLGDVNDSWNSAFGRSAVTSSSTITLTAGNASVAETGSNFSIPVSTAESDAMAVQFTLRWPKNKLQFVSASPVFSGCVIGQPTDSTLTVLATDPSGSLIPAGSTLLNMQFTALGTAGSEAEIQINSDVTPALAYDADLIQMNLNRVPGLVTVSGTTSVSSERFSNLVQLWPNPSRGSFYVKAGIGSQFDLQDALGRKIFSQKLDKELTEISLKGVSAGIYQVKVGAEVLRLVVE